MPTKEQSAYWLAGFVDGEGCIYSRRSILPSGKHHSRRIITITNTDPALMDYAASCLDVLGIHYHRSNRTGATTNRKHRYTIDILKGVDMFRFRELVPIQSPDKKARLDEALSFVRDIHCKECGCLHDEQTVGCYDCRKRHEVRERAKAKRRSKTTQSSSNLPPQK